MALTAGDPVVGGVILRIPAIQSPNFVTGVSGWQIAIDGSAQFNNLTIRGTFLGADFIISSAGIFLYSGTPAAGNLIMSMSPTATSDSFGNTVRAGGLAVYGAAGQNVFLGLISGVSELQFATGQAMEKTAANVASGTAGSGTAEQLLAFISGPQGNHAGQQDWVQIEMVSAANGGAAGAAGFLNYITTGGAVQAALEWSSAGIAAALINGLALSTFSALGSASSPGANAGTPPTGTATQASSFAAGSPALSYLTALEGTYNTTVAAVANHAALLNAIVAILNGWL